MMSFRSCCFSGWPGQREIQGVLFRDRFSGVLFHILDFQISDFQIFYS